jgi:hypothetical protein
MRHARPFTLAAALAAGFSTTAAAQTDDGLELWLNPSVSWSLDDDTEVEVETAQRFRRGADGRGDTYYARLWLNQDVSKALSVSAGLEQRTNQPGADETRLLQQVSARRGVLRTRLRLEQRFVDGGRMGVRLRPRAGVELPLGSSGRWSAKANAELFLTLRSTTPGGDEGLTGVRTQIGAGYKVTERLSVTVAYLRQQDVREGRPDVVGHAPLIGVELSF